MKRILKMILTLKITITYNFSSFNNLSNNNFSLIRFGGLSHGFKEIDIHQPNSVLSHYGLS